MLALTVAIGGGLSAILATDILVMPGLAQIAGQYSCHLVGIAHPGFAAVTGIGVAFIVAMTAICYLGIELSALTQKLLLGAEVVILVVFAAVALTKVYGGAADGSSSGGQDAPGVDAANGSDGLAPETGGDADAGSDTGIVDTGSDALTCLQNIPGNCPDCMTQNAVLAVNTSTAAILPVYFSMTGSAVAAVTASR